MSNIQTDHQGIVAEQSRLAAFSGFFFSIVWGLRSNAGLESVDNRTCGYSIHVDVVYITGGCGCHHIFYAAKFALSIGCNG